MMEILFCLIASLRSRLGDRRELALENLALRHYAEPRTILSSAGPIRHRARVCGVATMFVSYSTRHSFLRKPLTSLCVFARIVPSHGIGLSSAVRSSSAVAIGAAGSFAAIDCCLDAQNS